MKCVKCGSDAKWKDRSDGRCPSCKQRFAFEPQRGDPMTDGVFASAIARVSSDNRVRFTADHLYYEIRRRYRRTLKSFAAVRGFLFFLVTMLLGIAAAVNFGGLALLAAVVAGAVLFYAWFSVSSGVAERKRLPRAKFDALFRRYTDAHGTPKTLIERKEPSPRRAPLAATSEEMLAYSFDRAVICDRADTVDLLIANQFHFENNCAVLGVHGYPAHAFETVRTMLRNNPKLVVVALHDATVEGCQLAHRLRNDPAWFKDRARVTDIGLRPAHHSSFPNQEDRLERPVTVHAGDGISDDEARWLSHSALALAVVTPEQVIKRLFRSITLAEDKQDGSSSSDSGGGGGSSSSNDDFGSDADASDGGGDSFG